MAFPARGASLTGLSDKTLRCKIKTGALKARKGKTVNAKIQVKITNDFFGQIHTEAQSNEQEKFTTVSGTNIEEDTAVKVTGALERDAFSSDFDTIEKQLIDREMVQSLLREFLSSLLKREEERQARELAELEKQDLIKQVEALKAEQAELKAAADKAAALEKELTLAKRPWWEKMFGTPAQE